MINQEKADGILKEAIGKDRKHKHYKRTVDIAKYARQMHLGDTQKDLIVRHKLNETEEQKKQRVRLYNSLTPFAITQIKKQISKIRRTDHISINISNVGQSSNEDLEKKISSFYAGQSLSDWLFDRMEYYYLNDPNAFIICERKNLTNQRGGVDDVEVYPFEVTSEQAVNYHRENGKLTWLLIEHKRAIQKNKKEKITYKEATKQEKPQDIKHLSEFYFYTIGFVIKLTEYEEIEDLDTDLKEDEDFPIKTEGGKDRNFKYQYFENGTIEIPAIQVGTILDIETYNGSYITPIHLVKDIFDDLIQLKSQEDITRAIHVFAKLFQYAPSCDFENDIGRCENGVIENDTCPSCKGAGVKIHTSDQEAILLALPDDYEKFFPLDQIAHYLTPPEHVPEYLDKKINQAIGRISIGIFGSDIFERPHNVATATQVLDEKDEIHDVLKPIGTTYSQVFEKMVRVTGQYLGLEKVEVNHSFPKDFKTRSLNQLQKAYREAVDSGSSWEVLWGIEKDILSKVYANNQIVVLSAEVWQNWKPFKGKSTEEIVFIISGRADDDFDKILYENFDRIRRDLDVESNFSFHLLDYKEQNSRITQKVETLSSEVKYRTATLAPSFLEDED